MDGNNAQLETRLKELRLATFIRNYRRFALEATQKDWSFDQYLLALAEVEVAQREKNSQARRIKEARFPVLKELDDFDFGHLPNLDKNRILDLSKGDYIQNAEPIILIGNPGLGKTHIATSLALEACRQGYRVRFYSAAALANDLIHAQDKRTISKFMEAALRYHVTVVDELGFMPFSTEGAQLIFQFFSTLHEKMAVIVTTNLKFGDWNRIFGDERLTVALLDRLTHRGHILEFVGESYRFHERMQRATN